MLIRNAELQKMMNDELEALISRATAILDERKDKMEKLKKVDAEIKAILTEAGLSLDDLRLSKPTPVRQAAAIKYRDKEDASLTWTGRGKRPLWLQARLAGGAQLESFLVS